MKWFDENGRERGKLIVRPPQIFKKTKMEKENRNQRERRSGRNGDRRSRNQHHEITRKDRYD